MSEIERESMDYDVVIVGGGRTDLPQIVDRYMNGKIELAPMITRTLSLDGLGKGFDLMHAGESIRAAMPY